MVIMHTEMLHYEKPKTRNKLMV